MMADIRVAFKALVLQAKWMDEETRNHALHKLRTMGQLIGYPDFFVKPGYVEEEYRGVSTIHVIFEEFSNKNRNKKSNNNYIISMEFTNSCPSVNVFRPPIFFVQEIKVIISSNRLVKYEGSSLLNKPVNVHGLVQSHPPPTLTNYFSTSQYNMASTLLLHLQSGCFLRHTEQQFCVYLLYYKF